MASPTVVTTPSDRRLNFLLAQLRQSSLLDPGLVDAFGEFASRHPDALSRECQPAHVTASAVLMSPDHQQVCLTFHPRASAWFQLGGHVEPTDVSVRAAAEREVREEAHLDEVEIAVPVVGLRRYRLTPEFSCAGFHWDVQFVAIGQPPPDSSSAASGSDPHGPQVRWFDRRQMPPVDATVSHLVARAVELG